MENPKTYGITQTKQFENKSTNQNQAEKETKEQTEEQAEEQTTLADKITYAICLITASYFIGRFIIGIGFNV